MHPVTIDAFNDELEKIAVSMDWGNEHLTSHMEKNLKKPAATFGHEAGRMMSTGVRFGAHQAKRGKFSPTTTNMDLHERGEKVLDAIKTRGKADPKVRKALQGSADIAAKDIRTLGRASGVSKARIARGIARSKNLARALAR